MFCFSVLPVLIAHRKNDGKVLGAEYIFVIETKAKRFLMQKKEKSRTFALLFLPTEKMTRKGLVLEGGAMRGLFSAGVMDVMLEAGIAFDGIVGVSAGAAFGCNYKSHQAGRAIRYNMRFARDKRYCSWWSFFRTGDLFNAKFAYHTVPSELDLFDNAAFEADPTEYYVVCTDVESGEAVYHLLEKGGHQAYDWIRASASMPVVSKMVELGGKKLLDGGVADSIPLQFFEEKGFSRNVVVLTQPDGYVKKKNPFLPLMRLWLRKYPNMVRALAERHLMYNRQLEYVRARENADSALVIRPPHALDIGHVSHNPEEMKAVYDIGRKTAEQQLEQIKRFLEG